MTTKPMQRPGRGSTKNKLLAKTAAKKRTPATSFALPSVLESKGAFYFSSPVGGSNDSFNSDLIFLT